MQLDISQELQNSVARHAKRNKQPIRLSYETLIRMGLVANNKLANGKIDFMKGKLKI